MPSHGKKAAKRSRRAKSTPKSAKRTLTKSTSEQNPEATVETARAPSQEDLDETTDPLYFWKPEGPNGWLGQWYSSGWTHDGEVYKTAEMWMMVHKARAFGDEETAKLIFRTSSPRKNREQARQVTGFDESIWKESKMDVVVQGNYLKFTASAHASKLRAQLLATGECELVEASPFDRVWGMGYKAEDAEKNKWNWGENLLDKALMEVRKRLKEENDKKGDGAKSDGEEDEKDLDEGAEKETLENGEEDWVN